MAAANLMAIVVAVAGLIVGLLGIMLAVAAMSRSRRMVALTAKRIRSELAASGPLDPRAVRDVAVVRYDALEEMAGQLSFSVALLNAHGDGVVFTSINGRTETRTYAKVVADGKGVHQLSPEEQQAVRSAQLGHGPPTLLTQAPRLVGPVRSVSAEEAAWARAAGQRPVPERRAGERSAGEQRAPERSAGEREASERSASERRAAEYRAAEDRASEYRGARQKAAGQTAAPGGAATGGSAGTRNGPWAAKPGANGGPSGTDSATAAAEPGSAGKPRGAEKPGGTGKLGAAEKPGGTGKLGGAEKPDGAQKPGGAGKRAAATPESGPRAGRTGLTRAAGPAADSTGEPAGTTGPGTGKTGPPAGKSGTAAGSTGPAAGRTGPAAEKGGMAGRPAEPTAGERTAGEGTVAADGELDGPAKEAIRRLQKGA